MNQLLQDLRYGLRMLARNPGFTAVAVLSLALGIGANTAIFSLLDALVLRALPVPDSQQLVQPSYSYRDFENSFFSYPHFERLRERNQTLAGLFAISGPNRLHVIIDGKAELASAQSVTSSYSSVLGIRPALGRLFTAEDDRPESAVAVISYGFWSRRFGENPAAVGATITLNQTPFTIIGVTPRDFFGVTVGSSPDITVPMRTLDYLKPSAERWSDPFAHWLQMMGRLKPEITREQAQSELHAIHRQFLAELVATSSADNRQDAERSAREVRMELKQAATGYQGGLRGNFAEPLKILMIVVGLVLLIACANLANLLLARATARQAEIAVRLAVGAGRWRLIRQLLTESVLLAGLGGAFGLLFAWWGSHALLAMVSTGPNPAPVNITPDLRLLGFASAISLATGILFGVAPAFRATRVDPGAAMKAQPRPAGGLRLSLDRTLVVIQVALSLMLLAGAGLFVRSLRNLWNLDPGYDRENVLMFSVDPGVVGYKQPQVAGIYRQLLSKIEAAPGARSTSLSFVRPVDGEAYFVDGIGAIEGRVLQPDQRIRVAWNAVSPNYFATLRTPLLLGRDFNAGDHENAPKVAIISETMARRCFPDQNAVGKRIGNKTGDLEIVGVVKDSRYGNLKGPPRSVLYFPFFQGRNPLGAAATFEIRYGGSAGALLEQVRREIEAVDKDLPVYRVKTLDAETRDSLVKDRLIATLSSFFGILALLVACIGLYGLMSCAVVRRTPEIGIRMALGAQPAQVLRMVLRESLLLVLVGVAVGMASTLAATRWVSSLLFGLKPTDPATLSVAALLLVAVAALAGYLPARRASRVDPMVALRYE